MRRCGLGRGSRNRPRSIGGVVVFALSTSFGLFYGVHYCTVSSASSAATSSRNLRLRGVGCSQRSAPARSARAWRCSLRAVRSLAAAARFRSATARRSAPARSAGLSCRSLDANSASARAVAKAATMQGTPACCGRSMEAAPRIETLS
jgi:hypothetical protein